MRTHRTARPASQRRGFALALALVAIVVIGALIAGAFFASTQDFRVGRNTLVEQRAFAVAEFGLNREIANWDTKRNLPYAGVDASGNLVGGMATGTIDSTRVYVDATDTAKVKITRLSDNSFWVVSEGHAVMGNKMLESIRRTTMLVRTAYPTIKTDAAIVTAGNISISGAAKVSGNNTPPSGWQQCDSIGGRDTAAVLAGPLATVTVNSSKNMPSNYGVIRSGDAADSNTYVRFGTETWNSLVKNADVVLKDNGGNITASGTGTSAVLNVNLIQPSLTTDGKGCNSGDQSNWGEPWRAGLNGHLLSNVVPLCNNYFPIIYSPTSLHLNKQGRGQGVLLVNGSLEINGGFEWYGVIVVRDDITKGNGTAAIYGSVLARNATLTDAGNIINGTQDVSFSKCAIESALRGSAVLVKVPQRAWAQLF